MNRDVVVIIGFFCVVAALGVLFVNNPSLFSLFEKHYYDDAPRFESPAEDQQHLFSQFDDPDAGTYFLYMPDVKTRSGRWPLVVTLHGGTGKAYVAQYLSRRENQSRYPSFILIPTVPWHKYWADIGGDHPKAVIKHVAALVEKLKEKLPIDPDRVYVIGCSDGGSGVFGAMAQHPETFRAGIAIAGAWDWTEESLGHLGKRPIWIINGAKDTVIPPYYGRNVFDAVKAKGGRVYYTEYPDMGHYCPVFGSEGNSLWKWLFSQR